MRFVELDRYLQFRKDLDKRIAIYFAGIIGIINFIFLAFDGFLMGVIWGGITFLIVFTVTYGVRILTNKSVERNREKVDPSGVVIDATCKGEFGLLTIEQDRINFISLQKFGFSKVPEIIVDEDLYIGVGKYKFGIMQKLKLGKDINCQISFKAMPNGTFYRFNFYDVDGTFDKVTELLGSINRFNVEKYQ